MNIAEKMRELVDTWPGTIHDVDLNPLTPECEDEWGEDYAIVHGFCWYCLGDEEYFDDDKFRHDIEQRVIDHFGPGVLVLRRGEKDPQDAPDEQVILHFHRGSQEIEVYRMRFSRREAV